jgi:3-phosphoshikimate 1-carboxyvinyltransferase
MGAEVEERPDGLSVKGPTHLQGATVDARGDHRIAMAFAVAALVASGPTRIQDADAVAVSYPDFFDRLHEVTDGA